VGTRGLAAEGHGGLAEEDLGEATTGPLFNLWRSRVALVLDDKGVGPTARCRLGSRFSLPASSALRFPFVLRKSVVFVSVAERGSFLATV